MTLWTDIAEWRGPVLHHSGTIVDHMYVVLHIADGSYEGTIAWQKNPQADNSSHFVVRKDGHIAQVNDTANRSGAQIDGNPYSIAVENEGFTGSQLTDAQVQANARILAKAHLVHGIPLQVTSRVGTRGLGHHSMGYESGANWGHQFCPGEPIKAQKAAIVAAAIDILNSAASSGTPAEGSDDVPAFLAKRDSDGALFICDGQGIAAVPVTVAALNDRVTLINEGLEAPVVGIGGPGTAAPKGQAKNGAYFPRTGFNEAAFGQIQVQPQPIDTAALAQLVVSGLSAVGADVSTAQVVAAFSDPAVQAILTRTAEAGANKAETE